MHPWFMRRHTLDILCKLVHCIAQNQCTHLANAITDIMCMSIVSPAPGYPGTSGDCGPSKISIARRVPHRFKASSATNHRLSPGPHTTGWTFQSWTKSRPTYNGARFVKLWAKSRPPYHAASSRAAIPSYKIWFPAQMNVVEPVPQPRTIVPIKLGRMRSSHPPQGRIWSPPGRDLICIRATATTPYMFPTGRDVCLHKPPINVRRVHR